MSFERGFTRADVAAVKAIPDREWLSHDRVWVVPRTPAVLGALEQSFGPRLLWEEGPVASDLVADSEHAPVDLAGGSLHTAASASTVRSRTFQDDVDRILGGMRQAFKVREYSRKTELAYISWVQRFLRFHADSVDRPDDLAGSHAVAFLEHLASVERLAAKSRNQAASALGFMFRQILGRDEMADVARAKGPARLPAVLSHREVLCVLRQLTGKYPATGRTCRWPLHATAVQREVKRAVRRSGITKRATCHTFRHAFATEALRGGCDIRTLQQVMGHRDIRTTMIYLHVVEQTGLFMRSPLDRPDDPEADDFDPVGMPGPRMDEHWDLAARQWDPQRPGRRPDSRRRQSRETAVRPRGSANDTSSRPAPADPPGQP